MTCVIKVVVIMMAVVNIVHPYAQLSHSIMFNKVIIYFTFPTLTIYI